MKAVRITYSQCVSVALDTKHAKCMRRIILSSVICPTVYILTHFLINDTIFEKKYYYYYYYSALGPVWAGTRAQSGDQFGSGTLHPGQVLRGSLPLLSPSFISSKLAARRFNVHKDARDRSSERWNYGRECCPVVCRNDDFHAI
jgi:hypothetical protein